MIWLWQSQADSLSEIDCQLPKKATCAGTIAIQLDVVRLVRAFEGIADGMDPIHHGEGNGSPKFSVFHRWPSNE